MTASLEVVDDGVYEGTERIVLQARAAGYPGQRPPLEIRFGRRRSAAAADAVLPIGERVGAGRGGDRDGERAGDGGESGGGHSSPLSGSATGGEDYTLAETLTIPANETSVTASLEVIDDAVYEGAETIVLQARAAGYPDSPPLEIPLADDEPPPLTLSADAGSVSEPAGAATVTVSVPETVGSPVEVVLAVSGSATVGDDYTLAETLTIPFNQTSATASLEVIDDAVYEGAETIVLQAIAAGYLDSDRLEIPLADDEPPPLMLTCRSGPSVSEPAGSATVTATVSVHGGGGESGGGHPHRFGFGDRG